MAKKWTSALQKMEGAVVGDYNPHEHVLRTDSPSINFAFGKGHGLPRGLTLALGGPPKGGKTLICNSFTGNTHRQDPNAIVVKFNTEFRERGQATEAELQSMWGIDPDRYVSYEVNSPMLIFDRIEQELAALCQDGMPLALVIIDSVNGIQGRRSMNADSIETQQIGDEALTLGTGFKRILPVQRKYNFAVILTCQIRAELDKVEQMRGNKFKMSLPLAVQHYAEYFAYVEMERNKEGKVDLAGRKYQDDNHGDISGEGDRTGHQIKMRMKDSSCGPKGRLGKFTLDYSKGIINTHEEIFLLGTNRNVITLEKKTYSFGGGKWVGKPELLAALENDARLRDTVFAEICARDKAGAFDADDLAAEQNLAGGSEG